MSERVDDHFLYYGDEASEAKLLAPSFIERIAEIDIIRHVKSYDLRRQGTFVDAGAHIGFYSIYFASLFRQVLAFEPSPFQREYLEANRRLNSIENLSVFPFALGERSRKSSLYVMGRSGGSNTLCEQVAKRGDPMYSVNVDVVSLDSMKDTIASLAMIKIDVEGFEMEVLRGGLEIIQRDRPIILCEVWRESPRLAEFREFLAKVNYGCLFPYENFPEMAVCRPL